ncbi:MAG: hypothetical protein WCV80_02230 [Candidatus Paceibacterota bacterium]|jgi:hypothetical protein
MKNATIEQLKKLKYIEPDHGFVLRARNEIFAGSKPAFSMPSRMPTFAIPMWALSGAALTALLVGVSFIVPMMFPRPAFSASLNMNTLATEYGSLPINIQLKEIKYEQSMNQAVASAISEVSDTKTQHLNTELLQTEEKGATLTETNSTQIDSLLETLLQ